MHTSKLRAVWRAASAPRGLAGATIGLLMLWPLALHAGTFHVSERGKDDGPGTAGAPWKTLQHAADAIQPGDTVVVEPGVYDGFELTAGGKPGARMRFLARPGVIVDRGPEHGSRDNINIEGASHVDIEGFEVTSAWRAGIRAAECQHVHIRGNHVHDNGRWGIFTGFCDDLVIEDNIVARARREHGIYVSNSPKRPVIRGNRVFGNRQAGIHLNGDASMGREGMVIDPLVENNLIYGNGERGGAGINCDGCRGARFRNNILYDNHANGITLYKIDASAPSTNNAVVHNTIWMSSRSRWCIRIVDGSVNNTFANNICLTDHATHGAIDIDEPSLRGFASENNALVERFTTTDGTATLPMTGWRKKTGQDRRSIAAQAVELFVDPDRRDLRLKPGSPALDAGVAKIGLGHDYFGNRRPAGKAADIGAIERCEGSACRRVYAHAGPPLTLAGTDATPAPLPAGSSTAGPTPPADPGPSPDAEAGPETTTETTTEIDGATAPGEQATTATTAPGEQAPPAGATTTAPEPAPAGAPRPAAHRPGAGCCRSQATADPPATSVALAALVLLLLCRGQRGRATTAAPRARRRR
jgi:parallel beta-helix repeat protein